MDFVLDFLQGAGVAAAIGIRPFLPVLLVGALAAGNLGVDFENTSFAFLEQAPFLLLMLLLLALAFPIERRAGDTPALVYVLLAIAVALGALEAAGMLADHDYPIVPGIVGGVAAATLGFFAARTLFTRVRRRLDSDASATLPLFGEAAALVAAGASVLFPPLALVVLVGLGWLLVGGRRRAGEKYAGLRILR